MKPFKNILKKYYQKIEKFGNKALKIQLLKATDIKVKFKENQ